MLFRGKENLSTHQGEYRLVGVADPSKRHFLKRGLQVAGAAIVGYEGKKVLDAIPHPHMPSLPDLSNPFDRETREKTLRAAITGVKEYGRFISHVATVDVAVEVEKLAKHFGFLFDSRASAEVQTEAAIVGNFSAFFPPPVEEMDHPTTTGAPIGPEKPVQPLVGTVGGKQALEVSDDLKTLTVTMPTPELPPADHILPNFNTVKIKRGKGGLEDKIENATGTSSIRDTELYLAAQKAAWRKLKEDPTLIPLAKAEIARMLRSLLGAGGNFETININFVDPNEKPATTTTQLPDPRVQSQAGRK